MAEIIDEIVGLMQKTEAADGWLRSSDIAAQLHMSGKTTMRYLHQLNEQGRLEVSWRPYRTIAGCETRVPAYRLKEVEELHT